ncbi:MAG: T9SS type A sorting domain-containing protein [Cyclobacteriaceae bacterium]|nr:T9SS type A sorting domain-containing protein [Cyclobacteriaceae bacterium]
MKTLYRLALAGIALFSIVDSYGQTLQNQRPALRMESMKPENGTVCFAADKDHPHIVPPPAEFLQWKNNPGARTKTANIEVTYIGFSEEAKNAFQYAVDIWGSLITSSVPIRIQATWTVLSATTLGGANPATLYRNFSGAQKLDVWYPVALAEKIAGANFNGSDPDIYAQFNSNFDWHYDPSTAPDPGKHDLITVVLHEIGHGLGFYDDFRIENNQGRFNGWGTGLPFIYDVPIETGGATLNLIETGSSPSTELAGLLTGNNLFYNFLPEANTQLYAPTQFSGGSSIAHLNESTYNGTDNALMTPQIASQEKIHNPGVALNMLKHMGWEIVRIVHQPLSDTEDIAGPYTVVVSIDADNGYNNTSVQLNYTLDGTTFTSVAMTPTGNPNEFSGEIPSSGIARNYGYYIAVKNNADREYVSPGKLVSIGEEQEQYFYIFSVGPDTEPPVITHTPKAFILDSETNFDIEARITDNIGIAAASVEYLINNVPQGNIPLVLQSNADYLATINLGAGLAIDDVLSYRITAIDQATATPGGNKTFSPSDKDYHLVNVVGLEPTQDSYANNFNSPSNDFFGDGFSITQPTGFSDPAIHTVHPYPQGNGQPNNQLNLVYQLKIPVRVNANADLATIVFDEIVLVEPGEPGTVFGDDQFWDYVIVEGSKDGGITWVPVADGYDSRVHSVWLTRYNSSTSGNNSTATGDPSLFRTRTLSLLNKFNPDDEVVIRFRLFSDPFAVGWGWAIDNLRIQVDDTPPQILHDHLDYVTTGTETFNLNFTVNDASGITAVRVEIGVNDDDPVTEEMPLNPIGDEYELPIIGVNTLTAGDVIHYRIIAEDATGNESFFPPSGNFLKIPVVNFGTPVHTYSNTFNTPTTDFIGNFFSIAQPAGFDNGAIHSEHFYPNGIGLDKTSSFQFILTKPITIGSSNTLIRFDEVVIVEGHNTGVVFGNPNFKDYVIVEGSKNGGETWSRFLDGYDIVGGLSSWLVAFNSGANGNASMFRTRVIDMTASGNFQSGDNVLIRFRLFANETINGWGWAIDNLFIQDPVTSIEQLNSSINIYPNPVANQLLQIEIDEPTFSAIQIGLLNLQGQSLQSVTLPPSSDSTKHQLDLSGLPSGMYIVTIQGGSGGRILRKIIKTQ